MWHGSSHIANDNGMIQDTIRYIGGVKGQILVLIKDLSAELNAKNNEQLKAYCSES